MPDHSAISRCSDNHPWVLIDSIARTGYCSNDTTAQTSSSRLFPIRVSFVLADPPDVSVCFVHCPGPKKWHFDGDPLILTASQGFVLLVVSFTGNDDDFDDYFVYRAGPGKPRLDRICMLSPRDYDDKTIGILPLCDGASNHYAVVVPLRRYNRASHSVDYSLRVFRSDREGWTTKETQMARDTETDRRNVRNLAGTRVISVGEGVLGWVDLWWGILVCNVLDEKPIMRLVQWPVAEPCDDVKHISPRPFRDVAVINGIIKFVELKFHQPTFNQGVMISQGWTVNVWKRIVSSVDWHKSSKVHSHDISIIDSVLMSQMPFLVPEILDVEAKRLAWDQVSCTSPTLSLNSDDDVVYIMVKAKLEHPIAFVFAVNAGEKTLEAVEDCRAEKMTYLEPTYVASAFSSYLTNAGPTPTKVLDHPYSVAGSNVENDVTVEPLLHVPNEEPIRIRVTASYSISPAEKDVTKKSYASIVSQGPSNAAVKPKPLTKPVRIAVEGLTPKLEHPFIVAVSNDENNVTAQPPLAALNEQPKMTPVAAAYFPTPAQKDVTKNTYASIVNQGSLTAVVTQKLVTKPVRIVVEGAGPPPELERPNVVDGLDVENNVTVEPHLPVPNEQCKRTPVAASTSLPPDSKDVAKKTYALTYEEALASLAQMERRAIMAETLLEAALQHQSSQQKAFSPLPSPRTFVQEDSSQEFEPRRINLLEPISPSWGDKNKGKLNSDVDCTLAKLTDTHDQSEEISNMDDEKHGETAKLSWRWKFLREPELTDTHGRREETPYMDDEKHGETPKLESEWTVVKSRKGDKYWKRRLQSGMLLLPPVHINEPNFV